MHVVCTRRGFLGAMAGATALTAGAATTAPKKVAAVVTIYRPNSHADVIVSKILRLSLIHI